MILRREIYKTPSGRPKQHGRNDRAWLVPEGEEERRQLQALAKVGLPTDLRGSSAIERDLDGLRSTARAIDPEFREESPTIIQNGRASKW